MGTVLRNIRPVEPERRTIHARFEGKSFETISETRDLQTPNDQIIEGGGRLAFSGFVNAHTHLAMVAFRGLADDVPLHTWLEGHVWPLERLLEPEDVYWCTLLAIAEGIRSGTVAFADMYFHNDEIARAVEESGVRALLCYAAIAPSMQDRGRAEIDASVGIVDRWEGAADGRIRTAISLHALYTCGEDVWRAGIDAAADRGVPIHTHVAETRRETVEWREQTGMSPVMWLDRVGAFEVPLLAAHCVHVDEDDIAVLAERGAFIAHCPKSNAKLGSGIAPIAAMLDAGVHVAVGTDGAASNNRLDMLEEMRAVWMLQRASHEDPMTPSAAQVVELATENGRRALGLDPGGFVEGRPADVVLVDPDRLHATPDHDPTAMLAYASSGLDVTDVIVDGRVLMRNGDLLTIDEEKVKSEVNRLLRRLNT